MRLPTVHVAWPLLCAACSPSPTEDRPAPDDRPVPDGPSVALVILDTLRADQLGCYGRGLDVSPELDALAAEGVLFESVLAPCSWTRPAIAGLLTGRHPRSLGIFAEKDDALPEGPLTLAEVLHGAGWSTFGITANPNINSCYGFDRGFDEYVDSNVVFEFMETEAGETTYAFGHTALPRSRPVLRRTLAWARAQAEGSERPGYLQVDLMEVHEHGRQLRGPYRERFADHPDQGYLGAVAQLSHDVGEFVAELRQVEGWGDALVVVTSDHGEKLAGEHPELEAKKHGDLLYESQLFVPLLLHQPGGLDARRVGERVRLIDLMPTVLELCGLAPLSDSDGLSLAGLARGGPAPSLPELFVAETAWRRIDKLAVYADGWRYVENRDGHAGTDPAELQAAGGAENGRATSVLDSNADLAASLALHLAEWERTFPRAEPTRGEDVGEAARQQLRAIGYAGD